LEVFCNELNGIDLHDIADIWKELDFHVFLQTKPPVVEETDQPGAEGIFILF